MRISDWSSDVCSSDLATAGRLHNDTAYGLTGESDTRGNSIVVHRVPLAALKKPADIDRVRDTVLKAALHRFTKGFEGKAFEKAIADFPRSDEHTSELPSLMRHSYAVCCLKKKTT